MRVKEKMEIQERGFFISMSAKEEIPRGWEVKTKKKLCGEKGYFLELTHYKGDDRNVPC